MYSCMIYVRLYKYMGITGQPLEGIIRDKAHPSIWFRVQQTCNDTGSEVKLRYILGCSLIRRRHK